MGIWSKFHMMLMMKLYEFSIEFAEIDSVVNTNELDCSVDEVGIKFDILHDVVDKIIPVEFK